MNGFAGAAASSVLRGDSFGDNAGRILTDSFGNALGNVAKREMQPIAPTVVKKTEVDEELQKLGLINKQANEVAAILADDSKKADLITKLGSKQKLNKLIRAYKDNLKSEDSYLDYSSISEREKTKVEMMQKALNAFGITRVTDHKLDSLFSHDDSGFYAALYNDKADDTYSVAFRGTDGENVFDTIVKDGVTDVANALGFKTEQYQRAVTLAKTLGRHDTYSKGLSFTGHSLGGGLATVAAASIGKTFNTFNAASVNPRVAEELGANLDNIGENSNAYSLNGEPLTSVQVHSGIDAIAGILTPLTFGIGLVIGEPRFELGYIPEATGIRKDYDAMIDGQSVSDWCIKTLHSNQTMLNTLYHQFK